jgi:hypothetical protein
MNAEELVAFYGVAESKAKEILKNAEYLTTLTKLRDALMKVLCCCGCSKR